MVAQIDKDYVSRSLRKTWIRLVSYSLFEGRPLTTRGRWINPGVLLLARLIGNRAQSRSVTAPLYILGQGRSGSTVLGLVLSMHREIAFLNEPKAVWHSAYPYEDLAGNFTDQPAKYALNSEDATYDVQRRLHNLYGAYLKISGMQRVLDKYPELLFRVPFVITIFPDARFLLLFRNGWDVCHSIDNWSRVHANADSNVLEDWWGKNDRKWHFLVDQLVIREADLRNHASELRTLDRQLDRAALEWILTMREIRRVHTRYTDRTLLVSYESLVNTPRKILSEIMEFCALPLDENVLDFADDRLRESSSHKKFDLPEVLIDPFNSMLHDFGYL